MTIGKLIFCQKGWRRTTMFIWLLYTLIQLQTKYLTSESSEDMYSIKDELGNNLLHQAVMLDDTDVISMIYNKCPELVRVHNHQRQTPVELAAHVSSVTHSYCFHQDNIVIYCFVSLQLVSCHSEIP